jgi:cell division protein FtsQ
MNTGLKIGNPDIIYSKRFVKHSPTHKQQTIKRKFVKKYDWNQHIPTIRITLFWLKNVSIIALLLAVISMFLIWILNPTTLPIEKVNINGTIRTTNEQVESAVAPYMKSNFFTVNLQEIQEVIKTLTWVKEAQALRIWPNILSIKIQEHIIVARWKNEKAVDETGRLLEVPIETLSSELPIFNTEKQDISEALERYTVLNPFIESLGLHIRELVYNTQQTWTILLDNGMTLLIGRDENGQELQNFSVVYTQLKTNTSLQSALKNKNVVYIDLRYDNGVAIRLN